LEKPFGVLLKGEIEEKERRVKEERRVKDVVMEILFDVVMEKNSLEEKTSLCRQGNFLLQREVTPVVTQLLEWTPRSPRRPTR
jgi:hypothetical protein